MNMRDLPAGEMVHEVLHGPPIPPPIAAKRLAGTIGPGGDGDDSCARRVENRRAGITRAGAGAAVVAVFCP